MSNRSTELASEAKVFSEGQALPHGPRCGVGASGRPRLRGRTALGGRLRRRRSESHGRGRSGRRGSVSAGTHAAVGVPAERQRGGRRRRARRTAAARAVSARRSGPVGRKRQRGVDEARRGRAQQAHHRVVLVALRLRRAEVKVDCDGCGRSLPQARAGGQQRAQLVVTQRAHDFHLRGERGARVSPAGGLSTARSGWRGRRAASATAARARRKRARPARGAAPRRRIQTRVRCAARRAPRRAASHLGRTSNSTGRLIRLQRSPGASGGCGPISLAASLTKRLRVGARARVRRRRTRRLAGHRGAANAPLAVAQEDGDVRQAAGLQRGGRRDGQRLQRQRGLGARLRLGGTLASHAHRLLRAHAARPRSAHAARAHEGLARHDAGRGNAARRRHATRRSVRHNSRRRRAAPGVFIALTAAQAQRAQLVRHPRGVHRRCTGLGRRSDLTCAVAGRTCASLLRHVAPA